jgi:hypothetical protein
LAARNSGVFDFSTVFSSFIHCYGAHEEVVIDVDPLALHRGFCQPGAPDHIIEADGLLVHITHEDVPLVIDLMRGAPELLFKSIDTYIAVVDDLRGAW